MKRKHSHVLIVLDADAKKTIDRIYQRVNTINDRMAGLNSLFFRAVWGDDMQWEYKQVKNPEMSRSRLLEDLASTSKGLKELLVIVDEFREEVKKT